MLHQYFVNSSSAGGSWSNRYSLSTDGVDEYAQITHHASIDISKTTAFTVVGRLKYTSTNYRTIWSKMNNGTDYKGPNLYTISGKLGFYFIGNTYASGDYIQLECQTATFNSGNWEYFALTYDGSGNRSGIKIYKTGVSQTLVNTDGGSTSLTADGTHTEPMLIGKGFAPAGAFSGNLDEIYLYGGELTAAQCLALAAPQVDPETLDSWASRISGWRMGDGATFPTIPDFMGVNTNDATIQNGESGDIAEDVAA